MCIHVLVLAALFFFGTWAPALADSQATPAPSSATPAPMEPTPAPQPPASSEPLAPGIHVRPAPLETPPDIIQVDINPAHIIQTFRPNWALGSTVDKDPAGSIRSLYSKRNVDQMLAAGYGWLSYRLFTELSDQDWHWNPLGRFSAGKEGYWTSSSSTRSPLISDSYGYRLPHRGNTSDQGSNEDYSRLVDGSRSTYWKSDPYLASAFTGDPDEQHPQWVVVDLGAVKPVNAIRIAWVDPYATHFSVQYWTGDNPIDDPGSAEWHSFPWGNRTSSGKIINVRLAETPLNVRFVRLLMTQSSNTCDSHGQADRRNCIGYAIDEISIGSQDAQRKFTDLVRHAPCGGEHPGIFACGQRQTATYVSSVDPWHSESNRVRNQEQPGLDLIVRRGLTRGMPAMYPVPMLYSTPENAVAELRYIAARHYPISSVELGEEPDGQYTTPEDDAALYVQWAKAIHALFPTVKLGGPVFSGVNSELQTWPDAHNNISWLNRFLNYLQSHGHRGDLAFMSFEHYPFGGCDHGDALQHDLLVEPSIMRGVVNTWRADGLPPSVPLYITEANFSAVNFTQVPMQIEGALWQADYMAGALADGVTGVVYYQYEPMPLSQNRGCPSDWGNLTMFVADDRANIRARGAQFFASEMLTQQWLLPGNGEHKLHPASSNALQSSFPLITAYAVERPDKVWSVMLVNKDTRWHNIRLEFVDPELGAATGFSGPVTSATFGRDQYVWRQKGPMSAPNPADEPLVTHLSTSYQGPYTIPAQSITVLRGLVSPGMVIE